MDIQRCHFKDLLLAVYSPVFLTQSKSRCKSFTTGSSNISPAPSWIWFSFPVPKPSCLSDQVAVFCQLAGPSSDLWQHGTKRRPFHHNCRYLAGLCVLLSFSFLTDVPHTVVLTKPSRGFVALLLRNQPFFQAHYTTPDRQPAYTLWIYLLNQEQGSSPDHSIWRRSRSKSAQAPNLLRRRFQRERPRRFEERAAGLLGDTALPHHARPENRDQNNCITMAVDLVR